ncbi:MAG TPA: thioredoxin-dependent thiol peroxidase [Polyangia bacterium]|jgi:peroxiredoxin Q/BCP|nr:thioredoxin-dependent thiol peroxidase [Polyangia bacterium]
MLAPGDRAPAFSLEGDDGKTHTLKEFSGKTLILYFYPKDNTPGCTTQACDLRDSLPSFKKRKAVVVGVSPDSIASHGKFRDKHNLDFLLLADPDHAVAEKYGAWGDKVLYGKKYKGIIRSTFVIDGNGKIASAHYKVSPKGHADAILETL